MRFATTASGLSGFGSLACDETSQHAQVIASTVAPMDGRRYFTRPSGLMKKYVAARREIPLILLNTGNFLDTMGYAPTGCDICVTELAAVERGAEHVVRGKLVLLPC